MKIIYVVSRPLEINSSASLRNINTIKGLLLLGHSVTVLSAMPSIDHPNYNTISLDSPNLSHMYISTGIAKNISVEFSKNKLLNRVRTMVYRFRSRNNIYDSWLSIKKRVDINAIGLADYDLMISSSDPKSSHLVAEMLWNNRKINWIQIWGDPFSGDITSLGRNERKKGEEEERFFSKCSKALFLSPFTCEDMKLKYPSFDSKFFFMPRPYLEPFIYSQKGLHTPIRLSYCGDYFSKVRNLNPLVNAVKTLGRKVSLSIVGNADFTINASDNIEIRGRTSQEEVSRIEEKADILVHLCNLSGTQIPGKIYNYSATNKPILFILDGDINRMKDFFSKYNRFVFCENTEKSIIATLLNWDSICEKISNNPIDDFHIGKVIQQIIEE